MLEFTDQQNVRTRIQQWICEQQSIALVPTMGNLHDGHLSLVSLAKQHSDKVVVTIFVNELQFNDASDYTNYPRTLEQDLQLLTHADVDLVYTPNSIDLYPNGLNEHTTVQVPVLSEDLCGKHRPGHFAGVCTVMSKLLNITTPDTLVMGAKDYQQVMVLKKMIRDLDFNIHLIVADTVRETDQLAMSSRNQHLSKNERKIAPELYATLHWFSEQYRYTENPDLEHLLQAATSRLEQIGFKVDYLELRDATTLLQPTDISKDLIVLAAAYLGHTRLIDNLVFCNQK